jgi:hypothetical protein
MYNTKTRYNGWHVTRTSYRALIRKPSMLQRLISWVFE